MTTATELSNHGNPIYSSIIGPQEFLTPLQMEEWITRNIKSTSIQYQLMVEGYEYYEKYGIYRIDPSKYNNQ